MKILAIESAATTASAALYDDDTILYTCSTNFKKTHSETLLPMIDDLKKACGLDLKTLDAVAVSAGPGSFTGLRIGAATAKGLAFALSVPVVPVPTLAAMAYRHYGSACLLCPMLDARREQVYTGLYIFENGELKEILGASLLSAAEAVRLAEKEAAARGRLVCYMGDGSVVYRTRITEAAEQKPVFAPAHLRYESAESAAAYAALLYSEGKTASAEEFVPVYLRKSQAEQERISKGLPTE